MHATLFTLLSAASAVTASLAVRDYEGPTKPFTVTVSSTAGSPARNLTQIPLNATVNHFVALASPAPPAFLSGNMLPTNGLFYQDFAGKQYGAFLHLPPTPDDLVQVLGLSDISSYGWNLDAKSSELTYHYEKTAGDFYLCKETLNGTGYDFLKWGPTKNPVDKPCEPVKLFANFLPQP